MRGDRFHGAGWLAWSLAVVVTGLTVGCAGMGPQAAAPALQASPPAVAARAQAPTAARPGSLWAASGSLADLYSNVKARQVGDILTVKVTETASASNKANTATGRESSLTAGIDNMLGVENRYNNQTVKHPFFNPFGQIKAGMSSDFDGSGTTSRSGDLTAYMTASVVEVRPNGNLFILGSREVTINNERQILTLSGIVRSRDISPDNVVLSTYIANARITYSGSGVINERQQPGWLARILDGAWPF